MKMQWGITALGFCAVGCALCFAVAEERGDKAVSGSASAPNAATSSASSADTIAKSDAEFNEQIRPLLSKYCFNCHNEKEQIADLALDKFKSANSIIERRELWELVSQYVHTHQMPPDDKPQPSDAERATISRWVNGQLHAYYVAHPDPGRVTIRRLNRSEYNNTVRDLVGVAFQPANDFPQDDSGYGFDNIGDVLSLPPVLMEKYLAAADKILNEALPTEAPVSKVRHFAAAQAEVGFNAIGDRGDGWVHLVSLEEDDVAVELPVPAGDYLVRVKAFCRATGGSVVGQGSNVVVLPKGAPDPMQLGVFLGSTHCGDLEIDAAEDSPKVYETRIGVPAGKQRFGASVRRNRGGENETYMLNGRIGKQQPGIIFVKFIEIEGPLPAAVRRVNADKLDGDGRVSVEQVGITANYSRVLEKNGAAGFTFDVPTAGEYVLRAQASAQQAGSEPVKMEFRVNGELVKAFDVVAPATLLPLPNQKLFDIHLLNARPYVYEVRHKLPAGKATFTAAFVNDFEDAANKNPNLRDRNLVLSYLEVVNPREPLPPPPIAETMLGYFDAPPTVSSTEKDAREMLARFGRRAYRRPVTADELDRLMKLFALGQKDGAGFLNSLKLALKAVLVSPHFLFRGEVNAESHGETKVAANMRPVEELALASRLSYFLWSSMPDDELLALAERGELRKNLDAQVARMIASPKSKSFTENFAGQWLQLRVLPTLAPDKDMFRNYDDSLRTAMMHETELLFSHLLRENRSVLEFLTADYSFVNGRLARYYGLEDFKGEEFQKVSLAGKPRRGILTHGSILTLTSNPTRTSPVKRGKFVLENLLGTPPPPPPADVPALDEPGKQAKGTLREQMEQHRENPACASCHAQMDPIGFGLENFDAVGKWRDVDGKAPVNAAGKLKSGEEFKTAAELAEILAVKRKADFLRCLSEKMLTYALGRGIESADRPAVDALVAKLQAEENKFQALVLAVVNSMPFQMQRAEAADEAKVSAVR